MMWRRVNLGLTILWAIMVPVSYFTGWIYAIAFISLISIYANFASHLAAWRADAPVEDEQLNRIEKLLEEIRKA